MSYKRIGFLVFIIVVTNSLMYFGLIPYIQKLTNSHLAKADYFAILTFLIAILSFIYSLFMLFYKKNKNGIMLLLFSFNIVLWIPKIVEINCQGCAMN
jgi:hypothetical protein